MPYEQVPLLSDSRLHSPGFSNELSLTRALLLHLLSLWPLPPQTAPTSLFTAVFPVSDATTVGASTSDTSDSGWFGIGNSLAAAPLLKISQGLMASLVDRHLAHFP